MFTEVLDIFREHHPYWRAELLTMGLYHKNTPAAVIKLKAQVSYNLRKQTKNKLESAKHWQGCIPKPTILWNQQK